MAHRLIVLVIVFVLLRCSPGEKTDGTAPLIITTTGMIEDAVKNIVGGKTKVEALMGPGVDPHLYKATQGDLKKLISADLIFYNGLHLEGKMGEILKKLSKQKSVIAVADGIDTTYLRRTPEFDNNFDPHIWFDVQLWKRAVTTIGECMMKNDTTNAFFYRSNLNNYLTQLDSLHAFVTKSIKTIPPEQRVLITAHDAFGYFGEAYSIEVRGLQGISTLSEYGLRDVSDLVDFIILHQIKAVFVETSVSNKAINAVIEGCKGRGFDVHIGGSLYSDAMGDKNSPEGTYIGMVRANTNTIVNALAPTKEFTGITSNSQ